MKIFACSVMARKQEASIGYIRDICEHVSLAVMANSKNEAIGKALARGEEIFPNSAGWNISISVVEIPEHWYQIIDHGAGLGGAV